MSKILKSTKCLSCGGTAFRIDRPYGDFCSMMCAFRGIQTEDEKEEETGEETYKKMADIGDDDLIDQANIQTDWDEDEWEW